MDSTDAWPAAPRSWTPVADHRARRPRHAGRIFNLLGDPIDLAGPVEYEERWPIHRDAPEVEDLTPTTEMFETGIKVVDLLAPYAKGGKVGLFAAPASARPSSSRSSSTTSPRSTAACRPSAAWARAREGNDLWLEMTESGVIDKTMLVFGQMNEPPGARMRVALSGLTMAEYFREQGQDVLLFIDNIFRFVCRPLGGLRAAGPHAHRRWATSPRSRPRWASSRSASPRRARARSPRAGDLRARRRPHRPGAGLGVRPPQRDDRALARDLGEGHLPGRGPAGLDLDDPQRPTSSARSTSRSPTGSRRSSSATRSSRTSSPSSASTSSPTRTSSRRPRRRVERFLSQPFNVAEQFTGTPGAYVPIAETIRGFKEIVEGKHDDVPERAFLLKGTIDDVLKDAGGE